MAAGADGEGGLAGEMMVTQMQVVGCVGMISNGPSRDVDAIHRMDFHCSSAA